MAYLAPAEAGETPRHYKRRLYSAQAALLAHERVTIPMRVYRKFPDVRWERVWANLHGSPVSDDIKASWYRVIHDIISTRNRLAALHLAESPDCERCGREDTITHKLIECEGAPLIWNITRQKMSLML
jgi:hypothetical protein